MRGRVAIIAYLSLILILPGVAQYPSTRPVIAYSTASGTSPCLTPTANDFSTQPIDPGLTNTTVQGNVAPPVVNHQAAYNSQLRSDLMLNVELVYKIRNYDSFAACLASIEDPASPNFRNFLNTTTLQPYVPTPGAKASVKSFFQNHGFITSDGPSPLVLRLTGTARQAESVFNVNFGTFSQGENGTFYSSTSEPSLPQNFAALIDGILGLDNYTRARKAESPCSAPYCPQGVQVGYSFTNLYSSGLTGTGVNVAVVDAPGDPLIQNSIDTFDAQYGLPAISLDIRYPDGVPSNYNPVWSSEAAMDVEAVHSVAPGAGIVLLYDNADPMDAIDYVATNHLASIVSNSWFYGIDTGLQSALVSAIDLRLATDTAQGLTILFASGDHGASSGTEFPASDPNVLAVGATNLYLSGCGLTSCSGYGSETGASISGGGYSGYFSEPSWQISTIGTTPSGKGGHGRGVPDVSMIGWGSGIWVYSAYSKSCTTGVLGAGWFGCSGTSLSTPLWAGFMAIVVQMKGGPLGNVDPQIYGYGASSWYGSLFHDVVTGSNGYAARTGWDPVTGWGSPVGYDLATSIAANLHLKAFSGISLTQGTSGTTLINVTLLASQTRPVTLSCSSLPLGATCSFTPSSANANYTSTLTVDAAPWTPRGSHIVAVNANVTNLGTAASTNFTLTVNPHAPQSCAPTSLASIYSCPLSFVQGWNLISLPVVPVANSTFPNTVDGIFGSDARQGFLSNVTSVTRYAEGTWRFCLVTKYGSGVSTQYTCTGTLRSMVDGVGYWVYAKTAFSLNYGTNQVPSWGGLLGAVISAASSPPAYNLIAGWNLVGFKPQPDPTLSENVATYLRSLSGHYDVNNVWIYDNSNASWTRATGADLILPGQGLWIYVTSAATLYP